MLLGLSLSACSAVRPTQAKIAAPAAPASPRLPKLEDPVPFAIKGDVPEPRPVDEVALLISAAEKQFEQGEEFYRTGFLKKAKDEFDGALDLLIDASDEYGKDERIQSEIKDLVARINAREMAAIRDGDGFTDDQDGDHAAIDDIQQVQTFPTAIDPKLKSAVEDEVQHVSHDLPIEINDRVLGFLEYYQNGRGRNAIMVGLERMGLYRSMIERVLGEEGVPLDLIYLCQAESAFLPRALSRSQAKGMWQFMSSRGKEYGLHQSWWIDERSDPEKSTRAAARHLKDLYEEFGDWYLAMAAYNAGPLRISRALERTGAKSFWEIAERKYLPKETINYIPNILALSIIGKNPEKYGFDVSPGTPLETERVSVDKPTDLRVIAEALDVRVDQLRELNAHLLRWTTPPDDPDFELILPKGYADKFNEQIAVLPQSERVLWQNHTVKRGDTLASVAKKYGVSVTQLAAANDMSPKKALQAGQVLMIPLSSAAPDRAPGIQSRSVRTETYTVRKGDTLGKIAAHFKVSVNNLRSWNHLKNDQLAVGKKLAVVQPAAPAPTTEPRMVVHKVREGETLDQIASLYKTNVNAIISWNKRNDLSVIRPGDQITIFVGN
jgi:membrane-bound lytic murein transglycosylase D